jgi:hypothetical protein
MPPGKRGEKRKQPKRRSDPATAKNNQNKRKSAEGTLVARTRMPVQHPEAPIAKKARNDTLDADDGSANKENQQQPCGSTVGNSNIDGSDTYNWSNKESDVETWGSVDQAVNSGGRQKMGDIILPSEEQRKKMALVDLKKQLEENRAELTVNDNLMKCSHRIKTLYFCYQKFVHFGQMSGLEEGRLRNWLRQSLKLQQVEFDNIWPRLRTQITRTLRVKRSGCASAMKYHFYGKSSKCS